MGKHTTSRIIHIVSITSSAFVAKLLQIRKRLKNKIVLSLPTPSLVDFEEHANALAARASKSKPPMTDSDHGLPLAPTKQDLNPWYSVSQRGARQVKANPLASIPKGSPSRAQARSHSQLQRPPSSASREGRLAREFAEREHALALVWRKQRERAESATATPSTVRGGDGGPGYADVFNRREVEDAHRERDRVWRQRRWEDDDHDDGTNFLGFSVLHCVARETVENRLTTVYERRTFPVCPRGKAQ
ncbi:hypothetical protein BGW80DRAFT_1462827 [Lactifluus volemus]|nr:hypothetical protein BGW80DRAFT_1462827 [Lactifluus volemus]